jgi:hypothetical protein
VHTSTEEAPSPRLGGYEMMGLVSGLLDGEARVRRLTLLSAAPSAAGARAG